jgi:hypothetical protein
MRVKGLCAGVLAYAALLAACGQTTSVVDCGEGEVYLVGNDRYCVYSQELIIEGFECPPQMSYHGVPGGAVCSPNGSGKPLPKELEEPFTQPVTPICDTPPCDVMPKFDLGPSFDLGQDMGVEGSAPKTDMSTVGWIEPGRDPAPDLFGQPVPDGPTMFREVSRSESMACLISETDVMTCWGTWRKGAQSGLLTRRSVREVQDVVVGLDRGCLHQSGEGGQHRCWRSDDDAQGLWVLNEGLLAETSQISMHHQADRLGTLCGLTASGELRCEAVTQDSGVIDALGRMEFLSMASFKQFSVEQVQRSGGEYFACGLTTQDAVLCATTPEQGMMSQGATKNDHTYVEVFVGERGGETVVSARRATGELDVWKGRLGFEVLQPPAGTFDELYSAFCGLQNDQVVCWDDVAEVGKVRAPVVTVLYPEHPRDFDMALDVTDERAHWCAISLDGVLTCSPFEL